MIAGGDTAHLLAMQKMPTFLVESPPGVPITIANGGREVAG